MMAARAYSILDGTETDYFAIQIPPIAIYSDRISKELTLERCPVCEFWHLENYRAKLSGPREYILKRIPKREHLVKAEEGGESIATPDFIRIVQENKLTGIEFTEFGTFV